MRSAAAPILVLCAACVSVPSSSVWTPGPPAPPVETAVRLSFVEEPEGAEELGVVEVNGRLAAFRIEALVGELRRRIASIGGDLGRVDRFATVHETVTEEYSYDCSETVTKTEDRQVMRPASPAGPPPTFPGMAPAAGGLELRTEKVTVTERVEKTCKGTRQVEVATLTLTARALRTRETPR